ncbi:sialic acid TRAP transporter substrate-binding protein SiaP [Curvibacter sp. HBC61]|uniref:Sialic acid TRAP transporter substrate-binding protein SiaP n=1 Tax=Curvibacter cyanobacteriorum TaxID=3026422 RepID=A0ABT5MYA2_9BURK|nr:sialic acid TRAP transporter substrate-binding protein SiaP [Curvibacter sp. HBC61]MDD0839041.1 sialic acid TRAP transporter substrate-binding protein SiaP [Curvibacter sp. HBC61]
MNRLTLPRRSLHNLAASLLMAGVLGAPALAQAQTKLKWAHVYETSEPYHKWSVWAGDEIKKRSNGKFEIQVFPASTLGKESDINQGLQLGTVDIIISGASFASRSFPRIGVGYYPYTFRDADHLLKYAKSDVFKELADGYKAKTGIQVTAVTYYGARHSTSNKLFKTCDDMKGLKMRVPDVPAYMALPRACGANPTPIAFAEVYLALQNGTVDAQENPLPTIEAKKFFEVQKNIILTGHINDSLITQIAPHVWNTLNENERKLFTEVMQEAAANASKDIQKREGELVDDFKKRGINVVEVDKNAFRDRIVKAVDMSTMGYDKKDWDRIQAIR